MIRARVLIVITTVQVYKHKNTLNYSLKRVVMSCLRLWKNGIIQLGKEMSNMEWRERVEKHKQAGNNINDAYEVLNWLISDKASSVEQVKYLNDEISEHLDGKRNWDELSSRSQDVLIAWEQQMEGADNG
jgi:hypothetical protein